jgi:hypothetical protein
MKYIILFLVLNSCGKSTIHSLDLPNKIYNRYEIVNVNKQTCELELKDLPPVAYDDPSLNGMVCLTRKDYSREQARVKAECKNAQAQTSTP